MVFPKRKGRVADIRKPDLLLDDWSCAVQLHLEFPGTAFWRAKLSTDSSGVSRRPVTGPASSCEASETSVVEAA